MTPERLAEADAEGCRDRLDWFSLVCAIVSADQSLMRFAAESAAYARKSRNPAPFFQVVSGILRARILDDRREELRQCALLDRQRPGEQYIGPPIALVKTFVERRYDRIDTEVRRGVKRHDQFPKAKRRQRAIVDEGEGHMTVDVGRKGQRALWAHSEAVFAKLAMCEGAPIKTDNVWFPLDLIAAPIV